MVVSRQCGGALDSGLSRRWQIFVASPKRRKARRRRRRLRQEDDVLDPGLLRPVAVRDARWPRRTRTSPALPQRHPHRRLDICSLGRAMAMQGIELWRSAVERSPHGGPRRARAEDVQFEGNRSTPGLIDRTRRRRCASHGGDGKPGRDIKLDDKRAGNATAPQAVERGAVLR